MKLTTLKTVGAVASATAFSLGAALAGPTYVPPAPVEAIAPPPPPIGEAGGLFDSMGMSIAVGYDTDYIFRGYDIGHDYVWSQVDLSVPLGDNLEFAIGAWYTTPFNDAEDTNELDLYTSLAYDFGVVGVEVGYIHYAYPNTPGEFFFGAPFGGEGSNGDESNEAYVSVGTTVGPVDLAAAVYYDFDLEVLYVEGTAATSLPLGDFVSLDPTIGVSYVDIDENLPGMDDSGWNHFFAKLELVIQLTDTATLTPYIATSAALDIADDFGEGDYFWGGVALSVDF